MGYTFNNLGLKSYLQSLKASEEHFIIVKYLNTCKKCGMLHPVED